MADPIAVIGAIASLATIGELLLQLLKKVRNYSRQLAFAKLELDALANDIMDFRSITMLSKGVFQDCTAMFSGTEKQHCCVIIDHADDLKEQLNAFVEKTTKLLFSDGSEGWVVRQVKNILNGRIWSKMKSQLSWLKCGIRSSKLTLDIFGNLVDLRCTKLLLERQMSLSQIMMPVIQYLRTKIQRKERRIAEMQDDCRRLSRDLNELLLEAKHEPTADSLHDLVREMKHDMKVLAVEAIAVTGHDHRRRRYKHRASETGSDFNSFTAARSARTSQRYPGFQGPISPSSNASSTGRRAVAHSPFPTQSRSESNAAAAVPMSQANGSSINLEPYPLAMLVLGRGTANSSLRQRVHVGSRVRDENGDIVWEAEITDEEDND